MAIDPPNKLRVRTKCFGPSLEADCEDGELIVAESRKGVVRCRPTGEQWREFSRLLEEIGAARWPRVFHTDSVEGLMLDGVAWSVSIEWGDIRVGSGGYQAFPADKGLERLLDGLRRLVDMERCD